MARTGPPPPPVILRRAFWAHLAPAAVAPALAFWLVGQAGIGAFLLAVGALWGLARARRAGGLESVLLFLLVAGGALSIYLGAPAWLALVGCAAALGAWDLDAFLQRLAAAEHVDYDSGLGRAHLRRLLLVEAAGLAAGLASLTVQLRLPFWWEALLVLLLVAGISGLIGFARRQADDA
jgi:hypothetical protein